MTDNQNDAGSGDFDDHEPGDVNGNIDPAYARKLKQQQVRAAAPADRPPAARREPRAPGAARPPRPARPPRAPRSPDGQPSVAPVDGGAPISADAPFAMPEGTEHARTIDAAAPATAADGSSVQPNSENHAEPPRLDGGEARGPRRNRRGRRGRGDGEVGDGRPPRQPRGAYAAGFATPGTDGAPELPPDAVFDPASAGEMMATDGSFVPHMPNPGAFGDPERSMDRSGRRGRNRQRRLEQGPPGRQSRNPRDQRGGAVGVDGVAVDLPTSGVNEHGERDGERLHKILAQQGLGSRRDMEAMIAAGEVEVNGHKAHVGQVVNERDRVHVKRRKINVKMGDDNPRILIYHKNAGEIVSRDDPEQRDTVFDRLPRPDHGKWIAIGRLDYNTEGLMLFTTYGELANRMMHPSHEVLREYSVRVLGELTPEQEDALVDGIELEDGPARLLSLDRIDRDSDSANHWYKITLQEGRNREVRRMFEHMGLTVSRLIRTTYGIVQMPSWLKRGQFKQLDEGDVFNVLEAMGLRSRKKLEKAARFGGARGKLPPAGPLGPMRSATEHDAIYNGLPSDSAGARSPFSGNGRGRNQRGGGGRMNGFDGGQPAALQQQQFPGFGGATEMNASLPNRKVRGNKLRRGADGDVNGNVMPGFGAPGGANNRRGGQPRRGAPNGQSRRPAGRFGAPPNAAPVIGEDGLPVPMPARESRQPRQPRPPRPPRAPRAQGEQGVGNVAADGGAAANAGEAGQRRGPRRRRGGRSRNGGAQSGGDVGAPQAAPSGASESE
ncbi:MAG: rRNA pseudouridine synthase [Betaproteobacteria bacterium]|nr:MAG: rRNA pseudouridine synthase [Betaproteobacteria bacterium]